MTDFTSEVYRTEIATGSPEETQDVGRILGQRACPGDICLLVGGLGSGKTTLAQGILWGLGVDEYARSPTFVLVTEYRGRIPMYHMDLYRLENLESIADIGIEEYLYGDGITVIEWAERASGLIPESSLTITIDMVNDTERRIVFESSDRRYKALLEVVEAAIR